MSKLKVRLLTFLLAASVTDASFYAILYTEQQKRIQKALKEKEYYSSLYSNWENYKKEYQSEADALRKNNIQGMAEAKKQYDSLLEQQKDLIAQHTKIVSQLAGGSSSTSGATSGNSVVKVSNSSTTTTKTVKVSKPVSTPKTATS